MDRPSDISIPGGHKANFLQLQKHQQLEIDLTPTAHRTVKKWRSKKEADASNEIIIIG